MKKLLFFFLIIPLLVRAESAPNSTSAQGPVFSSFDKESEHAAQTNSQSSKISAVGFSAASNSVDKIAEMMDDDLNIRMKSSTHMGDVLNNRLPVFGQNLFGAQCGKLHQARFFNPQYRLTVGDEVNVQMWGAYQLSQKLVVDTQGNIFIPEVGPVKVEGIENQKLNNIIQMHVKKTFKKGVNVYADLVTAQPVQVYVTGYVNSPGLYDGLSSDSIIYFLCAAGGINLQEGSFRDIDIIREGREIRQVDLYDFLLKGNINPFQLHQGDTIVVKPQKYIISVAGDVKNPYQYEISTPNISLATLAKLVNVEPSATYVRIQRNQGMKPMFIYQEIKQSHPIQIQAGDRVTFVADKEIQQTLITVKGQVKGPHQYIVKQGTTLDEFLKTLTLADDANIDNVQLFRDSVARQQKDALNTSLARLQRQTMTGETLTGDDAKLQATRSELITRFVQEAKQVETKGQVVLGDRSHWKKVRLENNDTINIPPKTSVVTISGDVVNSISLTVNPQYRLIDYIEAAGGFQKTANQKEFLLMRQNGQVQIVKNTNWQKSRYPIQGGDQLVVLPRETENGIKVTGMMSSILYQLAIAARVAMRI
ncbi:polysaccharide biosynthesis/export family protein [Legionella septentrionalis]|uniref:Sugar ABC transporter substrate-binding protein n=1 Tax=Legionella septentrionalis TaxID=2498109 RepID=A0A3S1CMK2_9GAMM|nr:SLBB domain-containing protein [Legionella septentrionalis]RUQ91050.1 sugar ABC transporter substrate-binding protein [Legionella septentrionalis]RUR02881.1 sugar ABC transporter substrate-binding protein [Legionella septentrionalis]RUR11479.1 sugar ABC transporter substrate-binding protein [Legionella septentrionalis]RUR16744.1 sugar ABC transporter substrate-binding protein [Legionella septentrionalis]